MIVRARDWRCICRVVYSNPAATKDHHALELMLVKSVKTRSLDVSVVWKFGGINFCSGAVLATSPLRHLMLL
ncbi:hypothetical protein TNCV_1967971 [Trichonephila clavipes]|nr:hypothetical protein TNCV_1967971 [Trichonephila clavipes]